MKKFLPFGLVIIAILTYIFWRWLKNIEEKVYDWD